MKKAIVIFSGGQDSTTCLFLALRIFDEVETITFDYNQRNYKEINVAKKIAKDLNVKNTIINANVIKDISNNAMVNHEEKISTKDKFPNTFVPGRNLLFLTLASMYAHENNFDAVITGVSESESSGYPDCSSDFIKKFNKTMNVAMDNKIKILTPLINLDKKQVWQLSEMLNAFEYINENTLTCYNGIIGEGCKNCPSCKLRHNGKMKYMEEKI